MSQNHGILFENQLKLAFPGSLDAPPCPTAVFDISAQYDKNIGTSTSIKTTGNMNICMGDARRIFSYQNDFRLLVLQYKQNGDSKDPMRLYEFNVKKDEWDRLKGTMTIDEVSTLHETIRLIPKGEHTQGRKSIKIVKNALMEGKDCQIRLNQKIGSDNQRRLQCSIPLQTLIDNIKNTAIFDDVSYRNVPINAVKSTKRK